MNMLVFDSVFQTGSWHTFVNPPRTFGLRGARGLLTGSPRRREFAFPDRCLALSPPRAHIGRAKEHGPIPIADPMGE